ncbi:uncharacterized protein LOC120447698 [Drosophila santomea]|uniref:uncharacterized protein LOC120447698 n=1 Tax=Drosophila santomea TaxID=129105 RepID=UPI001954BFD3|nr:uncharacterized protein LOC120447698 [Drosophila santomea]
MMIIYFPFCRLPFLGPNCVPHSPGIPTFICAHLADICDPSYAQLKDIRLIDPCSPSILHTRPWSQNQSIPIIVVIILGNPVFPPTRVGTFRFMSLMCSLRFPLDGIGGKVGEVGEVLG